MSKKLNTQFIYTFIAIIIGFILGALVLLVAGFNPIEAYIVLFKGIFSNPKYVAWAIIYAVPLMLTGLAVGFSFRTGLFNIGAEGQYIMGSLAAVLVGVLIEAPVFIHIPLALIAGCAAGALWASIAGYLKAQYGVNEVIITIMLNWIALYLSNYIIFLPGIRKPNAESSMNIQETANIGFSWLESWLGPATKVHYGIFMAVIAVFIIHFIINKTTLGYQLRAVGYNRDASEYGGIPVKRSIILSMAISGLLAGLAGAIQVLGVNSRVTLLAVQEGYGFDGISVALIGANNPIGILFASLFYGGMKYGGAKLNTIGAPSELVNIVLGTIIYFIAIANALRMLFTRLKRRRNHDTGYQ